MTEQVAETKSIAVLESEIRDFGASLRGKLILPADAEYEKSRKIWNGMIDKHPAMIVSCAGVSDVINAVKFARKHNLLVAVRGGGHNVAGNGTCDGGMVIDFSNMKSVRVDPVSQTARAEPGLDWGEFDRETQEFGLAVTGGLVSTTGIAGFTLGGGIGWLARKQGLTLDNLISADVVTAEGKLVVANANENADLFWGIRGGGGNFGIVTSLQYKLQPVGPIVLGGMVIYSISSAKDALRFYREFVKTTPDELTTVAAFFTAPPAPFLPSSIHNTKVMGILGCYSGSIQDGEKVLASLRGYGKPLVDLFQPMPYRVLQSFLDASAPPNIQNFWKSEYLFDLTDDAIDTILEYNSKVTSPLTAIHIHQLGGKMGRVPEDSTAFSHRNASFILNIVGSWIETADNDRNVEWVREFFSRMQRFSPGGVYVNFLGEEGDERIKSAYGEEKYKRLVKLKNKYDPENFFRMNQNIKPSKN